MRMTKETYECDNCKCDDYEWFDHNEGMRICNDCILNYAHEKDAHVEYDDKDGYEIYYLLGEKIGSNKSDKDFENVIPRLAKHFGIEKIEWED